VTFGTRIHGSECLLTNWISCASSYEIEDSGRSAAQDDMLGFMERIAAIEAELRVAGPKHLRRSRLLADLGNGPSGVEHN
jgi:hypothetical protein